MKIIIKSIITFCLHYLSVGAISAAPGKASPGPEKGIAHTKTTATDKLKDTSFVNPVIDTSFYRINTTYKAALNRLQFQAAALKDYVAENNFNTEHCFLVDMSIPSGKNRFFIYNLKKDSIELSSLVAHGFGSTRKNSYDELVFSNTPNSFKTSLGKYKIGYAYKGSFGLSYKLYGLDSTNSKAFERTIVLHADQLVPEKEVFPYHIFQSAGCPTVSPSFLGVLTNYIKASRKPILLWIYYSA